MGKMVMVAGVRAPRELKKGKCGEEELESSIEYLFTCFSVAPYKFLLLFFPGKTWAIPGGHHRAAMVGQQARRGHVPLIPWLLFEKLGQFVFRKMGLKRTAWNDRSVCRLVRNLFLWSRFKEWGVQGNSFEPFLEKLLGRRVYQQLRLPALKKSTQIWWMRQGNEPIVLWILECSRL